MEHPVSTDAGTWYPQACEFLTRSSYSFLSGKNIPLRKKHSYQEKSMNERRMQYIKDRTENFDDYFPCRKENCNPEHVKQWLNLFTYQYNISIRA